MPAKVLKTEEEVKDFVRGCAFIGTGGGGSPEIGEKFLLECLREGKEVKWVDISEISDDTWTCTPFYMGSIAPPTAKPAERRAGQTMFIAINVPRLVNNVCTRLKPIIWKE